MSPLRRPSGWNALALGLALAIALALLSGCATAGPNHVYLTVAGSAGVHDLGAPATTIDPRPGDGQQVLGLAYDFNTDHLFLRLAPAQVIRVIERPSGKILREMPLPPDLQTSRPADLAIRSSDRHLFAVHPDERSVVELTLWGAVVRRIQLAGLLERISGLACDQRDARLLVLTGRTVRAFSYAGRELGSVELQGDVVPVSLGYDSDARHYYVPVGAGLGEFDATGKLLATTPSAPVTALDAGPRSFVRVF